MEVTEKRAPSFVPSWERRAELGVARAWVRTASETKKPEFIDYLAQPSDDSGFFSASLYALIGNAGFVAGCIALRTLAIVAEIYLVQKERGIGLDRIKWMNVYDLLIYPMIFLPFSFAVLAGLWLVLTSLQLRIAGVRSVKVGSLYSVYAFAFGTMVPIGIIYIFVAFSANVGLGMILDVHQFVKHGTDFIRDRMIFIYLNTAMLVSVSPVARFLRRVHSVNPYGSWFAVLAPGILFDGLIFAMCYYDILGW